MHTFLSLSLLLLEDLFYAQWNAHKICVTRCNKKQQQKWMFLSTSGFSFHLPFCLMLKVVVVLFMSSIGKQKNTNLLISWINYDSFPQELYYNFHVAKVNYIVIHWYIVFLDTLIFNNNLWFMILHIYH